MTVRYLTYATEMVYLLYKSIAATWTGQNDMKINSEKSKEIIKINNICLTILKLYKKGH